MYKLAHKRKIETRNRKNRAYKRHGILQKRLSSSWVVIIGIAIFLPNKDILVDIYVWLIIYPIRNVAHIWSHPIICSTNKHDPKKYIFLVKICSTTKFTRNCQWLKMTNKTTSAKLIFISTKCYSIELKKWKNALLEAPDIAFFLKDISLKKVKIRMNIASALFLYSLVKFSLRRESEFLLKKAQSKRGYCIYLLQVLVEIEFSAKFLSKTSSWHQ